MWITPKMGIRSPSEWEDPFWVSDYNRMTDLDDWLHANAEDKNKIITGQFEFNELTGELSWSGLSIANQRQTGILAVGDDSVVIDDGQFAYVVVPRPYQDATLLMSVGDAPIADRDVVPVAYRRGANVYISGVGQLKNDSKYWANAVGTGVITGFVVTANAIDTTLVDISAGKALIVDSSSPDDIMVHIVEFAGQIGFDPNVPASTQMWIGIKRNATSGEAELIVQSSFSQSEKRSIAPIARLWTNASEELVEVRSYPTPAFNSAKTLEDIIYAVGPTNIAGNVFTPNGTNLLLDRSAGKAFRFGGNYANDPQSPNIVDDGEQVGISQYYYFVKGASSFSAIRPTVDPERYDNNGVLTTVPVNKWTAQRIYYWPNAQIVAVSYGRTYYQSKEEAMANWLLEGQIETVFLEGGICRAIIVVQQGCTNLSNDVTAVLLPVTQTGGGSGSIIDHEIGGDAHLPSTLAQLNAKISDADLDAAGAARPPTSHAIAGGEHSTSTLAQLNAKIQDADLDAAGTARPPTSHAIAGGEHSESTLAELNSKITGIKIGDVTGPASATDNAVARLDSTGKVVKNSPLIIGNTGQSTLTDTSTTDVSTLTINASAATKTASRALDLLHPSTSALAMTSKQYPDGYPYYSIGKYNGVGAVYLGSGAGPADSHIYYGGTGIARTSGDLIVGDTIICDADVGMLVVDNGNIALRPNSAVNIKGQSSSTSSLNQERYTADGVGPQHNIYKARGTIGTPSAVLNGDQLGLTNFGGFDGSINRPSVYIEGRAAENWSPSGIGSRAIVYVTPTGSLSPMAVLEYGANGLLKVNSTISYETLVTDDDAVPNKKYADDKIASVVEELVETGSFSVGVTQVIYSNADFQFPWDSSGLQLKFKNVTGSPVFVDAGVSKYYAATAIHNYKTDGLYALHNQEYYFTISGGTINTSFSAEDYNTHIRYTFRIENSASGATEMLVFDLLTGDTAGAGTQRVGYIIRKVVLF